MATPDNALQPSVTSPFGNSGQNLPSAVPPANIAATQGQENAQAASGLTPSTQIPTQQTQMDAGQITTPPEPQPVQPAGPQTVDELFAQFEAEDQQAAAAEEAGFLNAASNFMQNQFMRFRESFARHPDETMQVLRESGIYADVRKNENGEIEVKDKRGNWQTFESAFLGARDAFTMLAENSGRLLGGIAGLPAAAPSLGTSVVAGSTTGAVLGAVGAETLADIFAEHVLKIRRSSERSYVSETAMRAGMAAVFGSVTKKIGQIVAGRKATREAAKTLTERAKMLATQAAEDAETVNNLGLRYDLNTGKISLDAQQSLGAQGVIPDIDVTASELSSTPAFQNFRSTMAKNLTDAYDGIANAIGSRARRKSADELGSDFVLQSKDIRKVVGETIGNFRKLADDRLAGQVQVAPRTFQTFEMMTQGVRDRSGKILPEAILEANPGLTESQARVIAKQLTEIGGQLREGGMSLDTAISLHKKLSRAVDAGFSGGGSGRAYAVAMRDMRDALRDDFVDMMGNVLSPQQQQQYAQLINRYRDIMEASRTLSRTLKNDDLSKDALLDTLTKGKNAYSQLKAMKTMMDETDPSLWNDMASGFFKKLKNDNTKWVRVGVDAAGETTGQVNWSGMQNTWNKMDGRVKQELVKTLGMTTKEMDAVFRTGLRMQNTDFKALPTPAKVGIGRAALSATVGNALALGTLRLEVGKSLLEGMGRDEALATWLKQGGIEDVLKQMPAMKAPVKERLRNWVTTLGNSQAYQRGAGLTFDALSGLLSSAGQATKAGAPTLIRREFEPAANSAGQTFNSVTGRSR